MSAARTGVVPLPAPAGARNRPFESARVHAWLRQSILEVSLVPGATLDDTLRGRIAAEIRRRLSPRHVPDEVIEAPGIPHTRTGKKLEVPVTAILAGHDEVNVDPKAVDDYSLIDWYAERGREHSW